MRLLALVRFVLATQLKTGPCHQPYRTAYADIYGFPQSYRYLQPVKYLVERLLFGSSNLPPDISATFNIFSFCFFPRLEISTYIQKFRYTFNNVLGRRQQTHGRYECGEHPERPITISKLIFEYSNALLDLEISLLHQAGTIAMTEPRKTQHSVKLLEMAVLGSLRVVSGAVIQSGVVLPTRSEMPRALEVFMQARFKSLHSLILILAVDNNDGFPDAPSGSGALAASSEADPWVIRANGPWNPPDTTSPTLQSSHSGSTSPSHVRNSIPSQTPQSLLELQTYQQARPAIGQGASFGRPQPKSSLDPSSGSFKFSRKPSFGFNDDKENSSQFSSNQDSAYDIDVPSRAFRMDQLSSQNGSFLGVGSASRDGSMPPSRTSEAGLNNLTFGNGNQTFGSIGGHTPNNSIHSHRPSFSAISGSFAQTNSSRYADLTTQTEAELREKFAGFGLTNDIDQTNTSQIGNALGSSYSPTNQNFNQQNFQVNGASAMWNDGSNVPKVNNYDHFSNQAPFADQGYFAKGQRFDRGSVSPASSDYRRGLNSPKYYSGTPPTGPEQIYRPSSRAGPRIPQGPSELDRRLQHVQYSQHQAYLYGSGHFQGQYPPHLYDYPPQAFRQTNVPPYGYPMPLPPYPAQNIPTRPAKDQDVGLGVRSVLLEEFRSNAKSNKRYELKVCIIPHHCLYNH